MTVLIPGVTCWRRRRATRLSMIQDAGPCFSHLAAALESARRSIFILGWDVDSRTVLRPAGPDDVNHDDDDDYDRRRTLLPLLLRCLDRNPELHIYLLTWDFSFVYAFEREPSPQRQFGGVHPRLHFALDADHGSGGSHHQKVVVIDDQVAFVGGIDLTLHRWDTPAHAVVDPRRRDADGNSYGPFHDVHAAVAGPAAAALGELARARWNTRDRPRPPALASPDAALTAWPHELPIDAADVDVGLARTFTSGDQASIREIEALTLRSIASARRHIYAENQYLTSRVIVRALADQLAHLDGPEVVIVLPRSESGWMEQSSMGLLRQEAIMRLRAADRWHRLRLLTPVVSDGGGNTAVVAVHSKVLVVDDRITKLGSANFSNRSLGLDSECDLAVEADDDDGPTARFVASVRNRLLGEHLGLAPEVVAARLAETRSLCRLVDEAGSAAHGASHRALVPVPDTCDAPVDLTLFDGVMVDPPEPWNTDLLLGRAVPHPLRRRLRRHWGRPLLLCILVLAGWASLRHFDPHGMHVRALLDRGATWIAERPGGVFVAALAIALGGALFIPITILATTTLAVFGLWPGIPVVWIGATLGALGSHAVGRALRPRVTKRWLSQRKFAWLRHFLGRRAFWSVVLIRVLPVGNFGALNVMAGAMDVPRRPFLFGNLFGLLPGLLGLGLLVNRALAALRRPSVVNVLVAAAIVAATVAAGIAGGVALKRRTGRKLTGPAGASR